MPAVLPTDVFAPDLLFRYLHNLLEPDEPIYPAFQGVFRRCSTAVSFQSTGQRIRTWLRHCRACGIDPNAPTRDQIGDWLAGMRHLSPETQKSYLSMLRVVYEEAVEREILTRNPARNIRLGRYTPPKPRALSLEEAQRIIDGIRADMTDLETRLVACRDYLLVGILMTMGPRSAELRRLTFDDFHLTAERPTVHIYAKGRQHGDIVVSALVIDALDLYRRQLELCGIEIEDRDAICLPMSRRVSQDLFGRPQNGRRPMSDTALYGIIAGRLADVGLTEGKVGPHRLRKTAATLAWRAGADPTDIQHMLGHARLSTTLEHYIAPEQDLDRAASTLIPLRPQSVEMPPEGGA